MAISTVLLHQSFSVVPSDVLYIPTTVGDNIKVDFNIVSDLQIGNGGGEATLNYSMAVGLGYGYIYTTFDYPGAIKTGITGINDAGNFVGVYEDTGGNQYGFWYDGTDYNSFECSGASETSPRDINNAGKIVGRYIDVGDVRHGFSYDGTSCTTFDYSGAIGTAIGGINEADRISGRHWDSVRWWGFLCNLDGTNCETYNPSGAMSVCPFGINNANKNVGVYKDANSIWHGFLYDGTTYSIFNYPDDSLSEAMDINDADNIVGWAGDNGYIYDGTTFIMIDYPGASSTRPWGINNAGKIVGEYTDASGIHGFIATCISLPVRFEDKPFESDSLQDAFDAAIDGDTIRSRAIVFSENLFIDDNKSVSLKVGYDCDYTNNTGKTVLKGNMTISSGTLTIESGTFEVL